MINEDVRQTSEAILLDNPSFDNSIVGVSNDGNVIYDFEKMITELATEDKISKIEAIEFIDYNTLRAIPYIQSEYKPIILMRLGEAI